MASWDPIRVKSHIRLTAQKLAHLQEKQDEAAVAAQTAIANLLDQRNIRLARIKAEKLFLEDVKADVLGKLETYCDLLLGFFPDIKEAPPAYASPAFEPICALLYAARMVPVRELKILQDMLLHRIGPEFLHEVYNNAHSWVPEMLYKRLQLTQVPTENLNSFMAEIAINHSADWVPPLNHHDLVQAISTILDPRTKSRRIDLSHLQGLCSAGIPNEPPWLRPRVWRILLDLTSLNKDEWPQVLDARRQTYYDLARRLLAIAATEPTKELLARLDLCLLETSKSLDGLPSSLTEGLREVPNLSLLNPLCDSGPDEFRIKDSGILLRRMSVIKGKEISDHTKDDKSSDPPSRESGHPHIFVSAPTSPPSVARPLQGSEKAVLISNISPEHYSALLRIIYLHTVMNPSSTPFLPAIAITLYNAFNREVDQEELAHAEADTFWALGGLLGDVGDLADNDGSQRCMDLLSDRLKQADHDLYVDLIQKRLDPRQPHYSYRWLAPLLTYTLPINSLLVIWDGIFAKPIRTPESSPKLDFLVDICVAMIIKAKGRIMRDVSRSQDAISLWSADLDILHQPLSPVALGSEAELDRAFIDGLKFLQNYPIHEFGGPSKILETSNDLPLPTRNLAVPAPKSSFWTGLTAPIFDGTGSEGDESSPESDGGHETETPKPAAMNLVPARISLSDRLKGSLIRGISNESAMQVPPSPSPPRTPLPWQPTEHGRSNSEPHAREDRAKEGHLKSPSLWGYTMGLRESDAAATISKVGSNWKARVMTSWNSPSKTPQQPQSVPSLPAVNESSPASPPLVNLPHDSVPRVVLPPVTEVYVEPARPAVFRPPRDSYSPHSRRTALPNVDASTTSADEATGSDIQKTSNAVSAALRSLTSAASPAQPKRSGPKPLLLNASNLMTPGNTPLITRSATSTPTPYQGQWSDVYRDVSRASHSPRDSHSSISTFSAHSFTLDSPRAIDSDGQGRLIPLRRTSVVPSASRHRGPAQFPAASRHRGRHGFASSPRGSSGSEYMSDVIVGRTRSQDALSRGWEQVVLPPSSANRSSETTFSPTTQDSSSRVNGSARKLPNDDDDLDDYVTASSGVSGRVDDYTKVTPVAAKVPNLAHASSAEVNPIPPEAPRLHKVRTKRHGTKPSRLDLEGERRNSLVPPPLEVDLDSSVTPKADQFSQARTLSPRSPRITRNNPEYAEDGDDEGSYDDILEGY